MSPVAVVAAPPVAHRHLEGTVALLRLMARRDRVRLAGWTAGCAGFMAYVVLAIPRAYGSDEELKAATSLFEDPIGRLFTGPGYGFDEPTLERFVTNGYGLYLLVMSALMSLLLVVRHTRQEEQTGRAELVRAGVVGRHAPMMATLVNVVVSNAVIAFATFVVMTGIGGFGAGGSVLFAVALAANGLAFAGVATITAQVTAYSRAASGSAGMVLGAAFVLRAAGDMVSQGGSLLSWCSPLGWGQQTAPFVLDRWWPLLLTVGFAAATTSTGFVLSTRRDFGAGLRQVSPGRAEARPSLGTPWGLVLRLQRATILGWTASLAVSGLLYGAFTDALMGTLEDLPDVFLELFGEDDLLAGYLAYMAVFMAYLAGMYAIHAVQGMRSEEVEGRAEAVLSTAVGRSTWCAAHVGVAAVAASVMMAITGLATGLGAALVTGDAHHLADMTWAHLNQVPAVLVVLGVAALFVGWAPRALPLTWAVVVYGLLVGTFGELMNLPRVVFDVSPYEHLARLPQEAFSPVPAVLLTLLAAALAALGMLGFSRRDLDTR